MKQNRSRVLALTTLTTLATLAGWAVYTGQSPSQDKNLANAEVATANTESATSEWNREETATTGVKPYSMTSMAMQSTTPTEMNPQEAEPATANALNPFSRTATTNDDTLPTETPVAMLPANDRVNVAAETQATETAQHSPTIRSAEAVLTRGQNPTPESYGAGTDTNPLRSGGGNLVPSPAAVSSVTAPAAPVRAMNETSPFAANPSTNQPNEPAPLNEPSALPAANVQPMAPVATTPVAAAQYNDGYGAAPLPANPAVAPLGASGAAPLGQTQPVTTPNEYAPTPSRAAPLGGTPNGMSPAVAPYEARVATPTPRSAIGVSPTATSGRFASTPGGTGYAPAGDGAGRPGEQALEGPQSPTLLIEKAAPKEIQVGKQCKFAIRVRNTGKATAYQVRVFDEVPQGTRLVSTSPTANQGANGQLSWDIGSLSPGEEKILELQLMPTDEGDIGSVATVSFAAESSVRTRCTRPLIEIRSTAGRKVMIGDTHIVNIEIHNPGSGDASGVMLLETIPAGVSHPSGPSLELEIGTLRAGETKKLKLALKAEQAGVIQNRLIVKADANLQASSDVAFEVIAPALKVSVQGPRKRYLERQATYTIVLDNPGTAPAKEIDLVSKLPKGMKFVRANNLGEYNSASHSVHWSLAELPANERGTVEVVMLATQPGEQNLQVQSQAKQGLQDAADYPVNVEGIAAIMFEVVDVNDPIEVGGSTSYEIRVVNQGSKAATNINIVAVLPPGMTATGAAGPTQHQIGQGQVVFAPLARLAPKADTTFRVDVQGVQAGDQRFVVRLTTDENQQPISKEESTRVYADE